ncbi:MAG: DUF59 domain-containing protein [Bacteroidaceae bacterium]|nr:DUF59 domain-containing protein [Bacteroidaceae bacterium]
MEKIELEQKIVEMIKTVYDPEIPVNIYDLGLIYRIEVKEACMSRCTASIWLYGIKSCPRRSILQSGRSQRAMNSCL